MNHRADRSIFCDNVKKIRELHHLSLQEMAEKLHIGVRSLSMIENGILPPRLSVKIIFLLCRNFEIYPSQLFTPL